MSVLYLTEQGSKIRKTGNRLIVEKDDTELGEVKCFRLESILLYGNIQVTTQALSEILQHGIGLSLMTEDGRLKGQLIAALPKNVPLRVRQHESLHDPAFALRQACRVVEVKIRNCLELLKQADWDQPEESRQETRDKLQDYAERVSDCTALDSLRGFEGAAAQAYFGALPSLFKEPELFKGRQRRPPRDPVNAVLSFGYVLLCTQLQSLLNAVGLDPFIGYLHEVTYGRPSLALDLLECYRAPVVDRFAVKLFNLKMLSAEDFDDDPENGFHLKQPALKKFFAEWEKHLLHLKVRSAEQRQVETLMAVLRNEREFPEHYVFKAD